MKIVINKNKLTNILKLNNIIPSGNNINPILSSVLIQVFENSVCFTFSNGSITLKSFLSDEVEIIEQGQTLIKNKLLYEIVSKITDTKISLETTDEIVQIKAINNSFNCHINTLDNSIYPTIDNDFEYATSINLPSDLIAKIDYKLLHCVAAKTDVVKVLNGILFDFNEINKLNLVATDSFKLAWLEYELSNNIQKSFIIDPQTLIILKDVLDYYHLKDIECRFKDTEILFRSEKFELIAKLILGQYPWIYNLFNSSPNIKFNFSKEKLISALERGTVFISDDKIGYATLDISNDNMQISFISYELGNSKEAIDISNFDGSNITICFNAKYLISVLKKFKNDDITMLIESNKKPIIFLDKNEENYHQLVLPVRID